MVVHILSLLAANHIHDIPNTIYFKDILRMFLWNKFLNFIQFQDGVGRGYFYEPSFVIITIIWQKVID